MAPPNGWRNQQKQPNDVIGLDDIPDTSEFDKYSSPQPMDNNPQPQNTSQPDANAQAPLPPMTTPTFAPVTPPAMNTGSPGGFDDDDNMVAPEAPSSGGSSGSSFSHKPAYGPPEAEPDPEEIKRKENAMFKQLEGVITSENIDGISNTLKSYGVDIQGETLKAVAPPLMPFLTKYGNRIMGGNDPGKFSELSAGASQIAEFFKDLQPVIGAIIAVILKPQTDATGKVMLRPEDEKNFNKLEGEVDNGSLSSFLQDGGSSESGLPSDMSPKRMTNDGRGATHESYASPESPPRQKGPGEMESIEELMEKARSTYGAAAFDGEMSAIRQRDEQMNAQPMKVSIQQELAAAKKRDDDMRGTPAILKDIPSLKPVTAQDVARSNLGNKRPFTNEDGDEGVDSGESLDERDVDINYDERDKQ